MDFNLLSAITLIKIIRPPTQKRHGAGSPKKITPAAAVKTTSLDIKTPLPRRGNARAGQLIARPWSCPYPCALI